MMAMQHVLARQKPGFRKPEKIWCHLEGDQYFEIGNRRSVAVDRFQKFVTTLPEGAREVERPWHAHHTQQELDGLMQMKVNYESLMKEMPSVFETIVEVIVHPKHDFAKKKKILWSMRKNFHEATHSKTFRAYLKGETPTDDPPPIKFKAGTEVPVIFDRIQDSDRLRKEIAAGRFNKEAAIDVTEWIKSNPRPVLQANECSRLHRLFESIAAQMVDFKVPDGLETFVVRHDWLAAFGDSLGDVGEGELRLPYLTTVFEFKLSGRYFTVIAYDFRDEGRAVEYQYFCEATNGVWVGFTEEYSRLPPMDMARNQIAAICAMLDAQVAEHALIRQPIALQEKRRKVGRLPLYDYHVVDLDRRHRADRNPNPVETGRKVRCHFRRGHWRHYQDHRTWINWMLVGDPDLGFVDKEYRL